MSEEIRSRMYFVRLLFFVILVIISSAVLFGANADGLLNENQILLISSEFFTSLTGDTHHQFMPNEKVWAYFYDSNGEIILDEDEDKDVVIRTDSGYWLVDYLSTYNYLRPRAYIDAQSGIVLYYKLYDMTHGITYHNVYPSVSDTVQPDDAAVTSLAWAQQNNIDTYVEGYTDRRISKDYKLIDDSTGEKTSVWEITIRYRKNALDNLLEGDLPPNSFDEFLCGVIISSSSGYIISGYIKYNKYKLVDSDRIETETIEICRYPNKVSR